MTVWYDGIPVITMATDLPHEIEAKCWPVHRPALKSNRVEVFTRGNNHARNLEKRRKKKACWARVQSHQADVRKVKRVWNNPAEDLDPKKLQFLQCVFHLVFKFPFFSYLRHFSVYQHVNFQVFFSLATMVMRKGSIKTFNAIHSSACIVSKQMRRQRAFWTAYGIPFWWVLGVWEHILYRDISCIIIYQVPTIIITSMPSQMVLVLISIVILASCCIFVIFLHIISLFVVF